MNKSDLDFDSIKSKLGTNFLESVVNQRVYEVAIIEWE